MIRGYTLALAVLLAACGNKTFQSLCAAQVPAPAACNTACNPMPGAQTNCPSGYHCSADGKCDLFCSQSGGECGGGYACTADGYCVKTGSGPDSGPPTDTNCPAIHFSATP